MSAIGSAVAGTTKSVATVYFGICIGLAAFGGAAAALSGGQWMAETGGTGVGAGVANLDNGVDAFKKTVNQDSGADAKGDERR